MAAGPCAIYFPHQKVYALAASAVFWVPIFKHLMTWMGCQPASRSNLKKLLKVRSILRRVSLAMRLKGAAAGLHCGRPGLLCPQSWLCFDQSTHLLTQASVLERRQARCTECARACFAGRQCCCHSRGHRRDVLLAGAQRRDHPAGQVRPCLHLCAATPSARRAPDARPGQTVPYLAASQSRTHCPDMHRQLRCETISAAQVWRGGRCRKGLIKTAIETGTPVVPCYHLGNSQTLRFGPAWLKPVSRRLRTSIGIVMGWMGTPLPVQTPVCMCVGKRLVPGMHPQPLHHFLISPLLRR